MMISKRLIGLVPESRRFVAQNVAFQWVSLVANICLISVVCRMLGSIFEHSASTGDFVLTAGAALAAIAVRALCTTSAAKASFRAAQSVKQRLRPLIYEKLLRLGPSYREHALTSEVVQVSVEGVDQLETYFGSYLPQLFYALLAPLTLFAVLAPVSLVAAVVLLVCVPLIPISIAAVQTWAKRLLSKYWGSYTALGDTFLENLQGLTTYAADEMKQREMNERAEEFRRITMRVLVMQLNSIAIMDIVAYGGAAAGIAVSLFQLQAGAIDLAGCLMIMLLAADYFLPMRQLGSFFHIAMNGMAASDKIFRLLDTEEPAVGSLPFPTRSDIRPLLCLPRRQRRPESRPYQREPRDPQGLVHGDRGRERMREVDARLGTHGQEPHVHRLHHHRRHRALGARPLRPHATGNVCGPPKLPL